MIEQWRPVSGFEGLYCVSNYGQVESQERTDSLGRKVMRRLLTHSISRGYKTVKLSKNGKAYCVSIHRLVANAFIPNGRCLPHVNHINGIKTDNRVVNLEWVSEKENVHHAISSGLADCMRKGKHHSRTKHIVIAKSIQSGHEFTMIGAAQMQQNGFNPRHVYDCLNGKLTKHKGHTFCRIPLKQIIG